MQLTSIARTLTFLAVITGMLTVTSGVSQGATLSGYVKDAGADEAGLAGVTVIARKDGTTLVGSVDSVDRGWYSLRDLPTGKNLHVSYQRLGYGTVNEICNLAADKSLDVPMASDHASAAYYDQVAFKISSRFGRPASEETIWKEVQKLGLPPAKGELVKTRIAALQGVQLTTGQPRDMLARQTGKANEWDAVGHNQREREAHDQATTTATATVASADADHASLAVDSKGGTDRTIQANHDTTILVGSGTGRLADLKKGDRVTVVYKRSAKVAKKVRLDKPAAAAKPPKTG